MKRQIVAWSLLLLFITGTNLALANKREPLWSKGAPGAKGANPKKDVPAITIFKPSSDIDTGTAIIICPGGGYTHLAVKKEGVAIAKWLNSFGVTGVVLEYRMASGGYQHPIPLQDAQRAIRTIRFRAKQLHISPNRIGIMGFSAGGHLAATAGVYFDKGNSSAKDPIDRVSCRPDFMALCYPVIAFGEPYTHKGSQRNLIGKNPPAQLIDQLSVEKHVTKNTPPTFLFLTDQDRCVPAENSVMFYLALRKAKVPAELHIYRKGGHGTGLAKNIQGTSSWSDAMQAWLKGLGLLDKRKVK